MIRRPPRSTLFPYHDALPISFRSARIQLSDRARWSGPSECPALRRASPNLESGPRNLDRKSTRLNSSHQIISYAVFCLKKKKNHHTIIQISSATPDTTTDLNR